MAEVYVGIGGDPRRLKGCYVGINGEVRTIREIYTGVSGEARLGWTVGINRLYFADYRGIGELEPVTLAIIQPIDSGVANQMSGIGGIKRRLFAFDSLDPVNSTGKIMELDVKSRAVIHSKFDGEASTTASAHVGGTADRLFKSSRHFAQWSPVEIDPNTFMDVRTVPFVQHCKGGCGIAGTISGMLVFSVRGDSSYNIVHEIDPTTLGVVREVATSSKGCGYATGINEDIFTVNKAYGNYEDTERRDTNTLAVIQTVAHSSAWSGGIGGTKS